MEKMKVRLWVIVLTLTLVALLPVFAANVTFLGQTKKVVFLWSEGHHPNKASCELLKHCLENSHNVKGIKCQVYENWPKDQSVLDDAAAIVIYSEGINEEMKKQGKPHPVFNSPKRLEYLDKLMKKGAGMVCIHYTLYATRQLEAPKLLNWIGAYYDFQGHGSTHWVTQKPQVLTPVTSYHPVSRGWGEFTLDENELYHNLRFAEENCPVPILRTTFPDTKTKETKEHIVAWALERKDGGRGFGFGGGHFYNMWINDDCRKMILNAILWTAKIKVPENGVQSSVPEKLKTEKKGQH
jgi:type 1 glutamine amidotransferase